MCKFWPHNVRSAVTDETETEPLTREKSNFEERHTIIDAVDAIPLRH